MSQKEDLKKFLYIINRCGYSGYCGYLYMKKPVAQEFCAPFEVTTSKK